MAFVERKRPTFTQSEALEIAQSLYRVSGAVTELPSERDQNFHIRDESGTEYVLKIASSLELEETLQMQNKAMEHIAARTGTAITQRICRSVQNHGMANVLDASGEPHFVRMLTYLQGVPFALYRPHSKQLLNNLGKSLGIVDQALQGFDHPAARRDLRWDFDRAEWVLTHFGRFIQGNDRLRFVQEHLESWKRNVVPKLPTLRKSVVYHDANEYNILVLQQTMDDQPVIRLIDFGDMLFTYTLAEAAIGASYAMLEKIDPLSSAVEVARGYHSVFPLTVTEVELLYDFICMRLCLSVSICAFQQQEEPENKYLKISEAPAWDVLEKLQGIHRRFATYRFREVCGLDPYPFSKKVSDSLSNSVIQASVVQNAQSISFPGEVRFHESSTFRIQGNEGYEWRSIHLGTDYFADPGTSVHSILDGSIHSFRNNEGAGDYGPTIVMEHRAGDIPFYILYGHLSSDSLLGLRRGKAVAKGAVIGRIGAFDENGNWPSHVHIQVICDLLDQDGTFPGLCTPSQKKTWMSLCPPFLNRSDHEISDQELVEGRHTHISGALSLSYRKPLHIVRGRAQYLYDSEGRAYLDCVNNVAHVGHSHPRVIEAATKQMYELNTNTRYLHQNILNYAKRLTATLPEPLNICFFVCSGSEANDLALRLARAYTGNKNTIVVEGAYHGNLTSLIEISPYKFDGPGGSGAPPHVRKTWMPDRYRGPHRYEDVHAGEKYAMDVRDKVKDFGDGPLTFIVESALGCGGQIILPERYLEYAFAHVRDTGGVCIVDEVQVGFGRPGNHFWCFESQNVLPDIVTMGKPIGNGHPLAAVVTTRRIAEAFENGMEYFNTFGGNPVSCAVGLAVLDVIRDEQLQASAAKVGGYLKSRLHELQASHSMIGDVRGIGLFLGVELVLDRSSLTPAAKQANYVVERMKERGILLSTDGPFHNVIKIKPPLVFSMQDADWLVQNLNLVLQEVN